MKKSFLTLIVMICLVALFTTCVSAKAGDVFKKHVYRIAVGDTYEIEFESASRLPEYTLDGDAVSIDNGVVTGLKPGIASIKLASGETLKIHVLEEGVKLINIVARENGGLVEVPNIPTIAFFGDSITAGAGTDYKYYQFMSDKYYIKSLNHGLSGSNIGGIGSSGQASFIDRVEQIPESVDMVFVLGGVNDFGQNAGSFLRYKTGLVTLIEKLIDRYPDKPIVFSTPLKNGGYFSISTNSYGNTLLEFAEEMKSVCASYGIPVIDAYGSDFFKDFFLYEQDGSYKQYTDAANRSSIYNPVYYADGVHPNRAGHEKMAEFYIEELKGLEGFDFKAPELPKWENPYADIGEDDPIFSAVKYVGERGIMTGVSMSEFAPEMTLQRGMFAVILHRYAGKPDVKNYVFKDVKSGAYYSDAVGWASKVGIVNGVAPYEFAPETTLNREQTATILYRFLDKSGYDLSISPDAPMPKDADKISPWAYDAVIYCAQKGLMDLDNGNFRPTDSATRAEIACCIEALGNMQ